MDDTDASYGNSRSDNPLASAAASGGAWQYGGLPGYYDLNPSALVMAQAHPGPRARFTIRLTRARGQLKTSDAQSGIKPSGKLAIIDSAAASGVLAAVSASEVYFHRPSARSDGKTELASLFNPYWEVHMVSTSAEEIAKAMALGGPK
ncbi:hypothetical protein ACLB1G_04035 [Oxalobacteraceae bacterium A2-2]